MTKSNGFMVDLVTAKVRKNLLERQCVLSHSEWKELQKLRRDIELAERLLNA